MIELNEVIRAVNRANEDGVTILEVDIVDIIKLIDCIGDLKQKLRYANISLAKCELESLNKAVKLDCYI